MSCGCPTGPGRTITDPAKHAEWHRLVLEQGGPSGAVNAASLLRVRGDALPALEDVEPDPEVRRENFFHLRRTAIAVLVERERTWGPKT